MPILHFSLKHISLNHITHKKHLHGALFAYSKRKRKGVAILPLHPRAHCKHLFSKKGRILAASLCVPNMEPLTVVVIYAPATPAERARFFDKLSTLLPSGPIILAGDFNEVDREEDRTTPLQQRASLRALRSLCSLHDLVDPYPSHSPHTFSSKGYTARLDRFLTSNNDIIITPNSCIDPLYSDHSPIIFFFFFYLNKFIKTRLPKRKDTK